MFTRLPATGPHPVSFLPNPGRASPPSHQTSQTSALMAGMGVMGVVARSIVEAPTQRSDLFTPLLNRAIKKFRETPNRDYHFYQGLLREKHLVLELVNKILRSQLAEDEEEFVLHLFQDHGLVITPHLEATHGTNLTPGEMLVIWNHTVNLALRGHDIGKFINFSHVDALGLLPLSPDTQTKFMRAQLDKIRRVPAREHRISFLHAFLGSKFGAIVKEQLGITELKILVRRGFCGGVDFKDQQGESVTLLDAHRDSVTFYSDTRGVYHKKWQGDSWQDDEGKDPDRAFVGETHFLADNSFFQRVVVPGHPELLLGHRLAKKPDHPLPIDDLGADLNNYTLFFFSGDRAIPCDPKIKFLGNDDHLKEAPLGPSIVLVKLDEHTSRGSGVQLNINDHFIYLRPWDFLHVGVTIYSSSDLQAKIIIGLPNVTLACVQRSLATIEDEGLGLPDVNLFVSALMLVPFQAVTQGVEEYHVIPTTHRDNKKNRLIIADSNGSFFPSQKWSPNDLAKILVHEFMGHGTHKNKNILFLAILLAMHDDYRPSRPYGKTNLKELWAVAHEEYFSDPQAFLRNYPHLGRLIRSVYTADGSRFTDTQALLQDWDLSVSLT